jgi:hypothetical protein
MGNTIGWECVDEVACCQQMILCVSSIDMYNNDVGKRFMK